MRAIKIIVLIFVPFTLITYGGTGNNYAELPKTTNEKDGTNEQVNATNTFSNFILKVPNKHAGRVLKEIATNHNGNTTSWKRKQINEFSWGDDEQLTTKKHLALESALKLYPKLKKLKEEKQATINMYDYSWDLFIYIKFPNPVTTEEMDALVNENPCITKVITKDTEELLKKEEKKFKSCCNIL